MSKSRGSGSEKNSRRQSRDERLGVTAAERRKQIIVGIVMGLIMGLVISWLTEFWFWLPAGIAFGLATGAIMKPPAKS